MKIKLLSYAFLGLSYFFVPEVLAEQTTAIDTSLNQPLQIIERKSPEYPSLALLKQIEGWVQVVFTVSSSSQIIDVSIKDAYPEGVFDSAAMAAVKQFKILPPIKDGVLTEQQVSQRIDFVLPDDFQEKAQKIKDQTKFEINNGQFELGMMQVPSDLQWLMTAIDSESSINTNTQSLRSLELEVETDEAGIPAYVSLLNNELGGQISNEKIDELRQEVLFSALKSYHFFNGYYDPTYVMAYAKEKPATVHAPMLAKSLPVPELRLDQILQAVLSIDADGNLIDIQETQVDGEPIPQVMVRDIFKLLNYSPAYRNNQAVADQIKVNITLSLVQKDHVEQIKTKVF